MGSGAKAPFLFQILHHLNEIFAGEQISLILIQRTFAKVAKTISRVEIEKFWIIFTFEVYYLSADVQLNLLYFLTGER